VAAASCFLSLSRHPLSPLPSLCTRPTRSGLRSSTVRRWLLACSHAPSGSALSVIWHGGSAPPHLIVGLLTSTSPHRRHRPARLLCQWTDQPRLLALPLPPNSYDQSAQLRRPECGSVDPPSAPTHTTSTARSLCGTAARAASSATVRRPSPPPQRSPHWRLRCDGIWETQTASTTHVDCCLGG
jgi:hypothetical protein